MFKNRRKRSVRAKSPTIIFAYTVAACSILASYGVAIAGGDKLLSHSDSSEAVRENACTTPRELEKYSQDSTRAKIQLEREIEVRLRGVPFRIPHGYMRHWFRPIHLETYADAAGSKQQRTRLSQTVGEYNFWFPDGRWPNFRGSRPIFWGCDDPQRFLIRIRVNNPFLGEELTSNDPKIYLTPNTKWNNNISGSSQYLESVGESYSKEHQYGLLKVFRKKTLQLSNGKIRYKLENDENLQLYLTCSGPKHGAIYKTCSGYAYWPEDGLGIDVRFLKIALPQWKAILETSRRLTIKWAN